MDRLDAIPVMDVEVDVQDAETVLPRRRHRQGDVVVDTEAGGPGGHRMVESATGMVSVEDIAADDRLDRAKRATGDRRGCLMHAVERRDVAERGDPVCGRPARIGAEAADRGDVLAGVGRGQLVIGRRLRREAGLRAERAEQVDAGSEPARRQRMVGSEVVGRRARTEDQERLDGACTVGHESHDTRRTARSGPPSRRPPGPDRGCTIRPMDNILVILIVILVIVVIVRGPKTLPQLGSMLGRGVKETRKEVSDIQKERDAASAAAAASAPTDAPTVTPPPTAPPPPTPPAPSA